MGYERAIVQRLFEAKGLAESSFESGGSTYKCVFGKYYKDGEQISRDEYFKAQGTDSDSEKSDNVKSWDDKKELNYKEFQKYAMANYNNGGDSFVEAWDEDAFNAHVQEFGPMTVGAMKSMMGTYEEVDKDMRGSGEYQAPQKPKKRYEIYKPMDFDDDMDDIEDAMGLIQHDMSDIHYSRRDEYIGKLDAMYKELSDMEEYLDDEQYKRMESLQSEIEKIKDTEYEGSERTDPYADRGMRPSDF